MARVLSQTLTLAREPSAPALHRARLCALRGRSGGPEKAELIELDLAAEANGSDGVRRLEDALHGILVRRSAPDWLPFVPGSSYWVPPRKMPSGVADLVQRLASASTLSKDAAMSLTSARGWPSSAYFIEGRSPHPLEKIPGNTAAQSDDDED